MGSDVSINKPMAIVMGTSIRLHLVEDDQTPQLTRSWFYLFEVDHTGYYELRLVRAENPEGSEAGHREAIDASLSVRIRQFVGGVLESVGRRIAASARP